MLVKAFKPYQPFFLFLPHPLLSSSNKRKMTVNTAKFLRENAIIGL